MNDQPAPAHLVCSSRRGSAAERLDLALHALAQLPEQVTLEVRLPPGKPRASLHRLARAYGIADRLELGDGSAHPLAEAQVLYTSALNLEENRLLSNGSDVPAVVIGAHEHDGRSPASMAELLAFLDPDGRGSEPTSSGDEELGSRRVAVVTNLVTHYRMPLFNRMAERLSRADARLMIVTTGQDPYKRTWSRPVEEPRFEHVALSSSPGSSRPRTLLALARVLRSFDPHIVLAGGFGATSLAAAAAARDRPFGIWSGELPWLAAPHGRVRRAERRALARNARFAIAYGFHAREYLRQLAPELPCVYGRNTTTLTTSVEPRPRDSTVEVLTVARLAPEKRLDVAIDAAAALSDLPFRLTLIGSGPLREQLERRARGLTNVRFAGVVPSDEILAHHAGADVFLLPSASEPFGLALVESMGTGAVAIASDAVGAVGDVAVDEVNSFVIHGHDPSHWATALRSAIENPSLRMSLGAAGQRTIRGRWTLEHSTDAMFAGLRLGMLAS